MNPDFDRGLSTLLSCSHRVQTPIFRVVATREYLENNMQKILCSLSVGDVLEINSLYKIEIVLEIVFYGN